MFNDELQKRHYQIVIENHICTSVFMGNNTSRYHIVARIDNKFVTRNLGQHYPLY